MVLFQDVTDGNPVPYTGRGSVEFDPEASSLITRYINSRQLLTLVGGGVQVDVLLKSPNTFLVIGQVMLNSFDDGADA